MFATFARWTSRALGTSAALLIALVLCLAWLAITPIVDHGMNWRGMLLMNIPSLVTLLMVFIVQHTQNHQNDAMQLKLNELIRAVEGAHNTMVNLEELSPEELARVKAKYELLAERVKHSSPELATTTPPVNPRPSGKRGV
jgi:low affinity Fe/Cu permease